MQRVDEPKASRAAATQSAQSARSAVPGQQARPGAAAINGLGWATIALGLIWIVGLVWEVRPEQWLGGVVVLWLLYNTYTWLVPRWRVLIISRRGTFLGFGYAVAAGIVTALPAQKGSFGAAVGWTLLNLLILVLPFTVPRALRLLQARPHWTDLPVAAYCVSLAWWWPLDVVIGPGLPLSPFVAMATFITYFIGVRFWNRVIWEMNLRRSDALWALAGGLVTLGVTWWATRPATVGDASYLQLVYWLTLLGPLLAASLFGVVQPTVAQLLRREKRAARGTPAKGRIAGLIATALFVLLAWGLAWPVVPAAIAGAVAALLTVQTARLAPAAIAVSAYVGLIGLLGYLQ